MPDWKKVSSNSFEVIDFRYHVTESWLFSHKKGNIWQNPYLPESYISMHIYQYKSSFWDRFSGHGVQSNIGDYTWSESLEKFCLFGSILFRCL